MLNMQISDKQQIETVIMKDSGQKSFKKLSPYDLVVIATTRVMREIFENDTDVSCHVHMIFTSSDSKLLNYNIKYYSLLKGYPFDSDELSFLYKLNENEENFDPSIMITESFFKQHESLTNNFKLSMKSLPTKKALQEKLKTSIDSEIEKYIKDFEVYNAVE